MTKKGSEIQEFLQEWNLKLERIEKLRRSLIEIEMKVTASYSLAPARSVGSVSNGVESCIFRKMEKEREIKELQDKMDAYDKAIAAAGLSDQEQETISLLKNESPIADWARKNGIYLSYAYKIKDRAIHKIEKAMANVQKNTK